MVSYVIPWPGCVLPAFAACNFPALGLFKTGERQIWRPIFRYLGCHEIITMRAVHFSHTPLHVGTIPERFAKMSSSREPGAPPLYQPISTPCQTLSGGQLYAVSAPPLSAVDAGVPFESAMSASFNLASASHQVLGPAPLTAGVAESTKPVHISQPAAGVRPFSSLVMYKRQLPLACHAPYNVLRSLRKIAAASPPPLCEMDFGKSTVMPNPAPSPSAEIQKSESNPSIYDRIEQTFGVHSRSSSYLGGIGLLSKFTGDQVLFSFSMTPVGTMVASIDSVEGFRRTLIFHANGCTFQRVTSPGGLELVRFAGDESVQKVTESLQRAS